LSVRYKRSHEKPVDDSREQAGWKPGDEPSLLILSFSNSVYAADESGISRF
jgi:hypothetical protein